MFDEHGAGKPAPKLMKTQFFILGKPLSVTDAINRRAAATGSVRYAMATADADYNGHPLSLYWNEYRGYYVCDYHWGERVVITRDENFARALATAKRELARQGRGASLRIVPRDIDIQIARADAELSEGDMNAVQDERPDAWKFKLLFEARFHRLEHLLITAATPADWYAGLEKKLGRVPEHCKARETIGGQGQEEEEPSLKPAPQLPQEGQMDFITAEHRMPPHPRGVVELLRRAGHHVVVREKKGNTGLAYRLDKERERTALQLSNRAASWGSSDEDAR
jgi:hypothetical protein